MFHVLRFWRLTFQRRASLRAPEPPDIGLGQRLAPDFVQADLGHLQPAQLRLQLHGFFVKQQEPGRPAIGIRARPLVRERMELPMKQCALGADQAVWVGPRPSDNIYDATGTVSKSSRCESMPATRRDRWSISMPTAWPASS